MFEPNNKVSILVPVYGVEKYIERCARSLFEQTYKHIEYIFVDDCSQDHSIEILLKVLDDYIDCKSRVTIIRHSNNQGLAASRNDAIEKCRTEFLMHVDSDDWIDKDCVEKCIKKQLETDADIVTFKMKKVFKEEEITVCNDWSGDAYEMTKRTIRHLAHNGVCGRLIRTSLYRDNNIKIMAGRGMAEDLQVTPKLFYNSNKIANINTTSYYYYVGNETSYTSSLTMNKVEETWAAFDVLKDYFSERDAEILDCVNERMVLTITGQLINCARMNAPIEMYNHIRNKLDLIDKKYFAVISIPYKIATTIKYYSILKCYVHISDMLKWFIKRI